MKQDGLSCSRQVKTYLEGGEHRDFPPLRLISSPRISKVYMDNSTINVIGGEGGGGRGGSNRPPPFERWGLSPSLFKCVYFSVCFTQ